MAVVAATAGGALTGHRPATSETVTSDRHTSKGSPIVVELFTSQGCSSCPSADRLLTELAAREDIEIIPLSFHVDYWNHIGWTDPFSSGAWSDRQRRYAKSFGGNRIYTPQMVVNGRWEGVGSNRGDISRLLERAAVEPPLAAIRVFAEIVSDDRLRVAVTTDRIEPEFASKRFAVWIGVVESDLVTPVGRGENASKTLRNDRVVRRLERLPELEFLKPGATGSLEIFLEGDWRRDKLGAVAFLQDVDSLRIHAAAQSVSIGPAVGGATGTKRFSISGSAPVGAT